MSRQSFVGGNWKSYNDASKVNTLVDSLKSAEFPSDVSVLIAPTYLYLDKVNGALSNKFLVSAQNCSLTEDGAYTGEISAAGLKSFGLDWVILGHSERRSLFNESNEVVGEKVAIALKHGLKVVACIGESKDERVSNKTLEVVSKQLEAIAAGVKKGGKWEDVVIAYEPVWAIGTGIVATPDQAQDTHADVRAWVKENVSAEVASSVRIIYGGSVKPNNSKDLFSRADIDGFLVGGASLDASDFAKICASASPKAKL